MNHEIFLRCHTCILDEERRENTGTRKEQPLPKYVLVFDTETTTDGLLSLNFGVYQFCELGTDENYSPREEGVFHADDLDSRQVELLRRYVHDRNGKRAKGELKLRLYDRRLFVEKVMYTAIQAGAAIVAFNLPFDLSRLAVEYRVARGAAGVAARRLDSAPGVRRCSSRASRLRHAARRRRRCPRGRHPP
jgi:hypothetical protein